MQKEPTDPPCPSAKSIAWDTLGFLFAVGPWNMSPCYNYVSGAFFDRQIFRFWGETYSGFQIFVSDRLSAGGKKLCLGGCNTHFVVCQFAPCSPVARTFRNLCDMDYVDGFAGSGKDTSGFRQSGVCLPDCKDGPLTLIRTLV